MNMKRALSIYSDILILRDDTYQALKRSPGATAYIVLMFLVVSLIAGSGKWLSLPYQLSRPTTAEYVERASALVEQLGNDVVPDIQASLDSLSSENLEFALEEVLPPQETVTAGSLAEVAAQAGLTTGQLIRLIERQVDVPDTVVAELINRAPTEAVISRLLSAASVTPDQVRAILATERLEAVPGEVLAGGGLVNTLAAALLSGVTQSSGLQELVTQIALTPGRIRDITVRLGLDPAVINRVNQRIGSAPGQVQEVLAITQEELETIQPPLGVRFSRFIELMGDWLSTPFQIAASYLPLALVALLAAKMLGGKATVTQHLFGMALAVAPAFLLFLTFADTIAPVVTEQYALTVAGRILGLIGLAWAFLILVKSLSVAHEFSTWRAVGTLALTYGIMYVVVPLLSFFAAGYLIRA